MNVSICSTYRGIAFVNSVQFRVNLAVSVVFVMLLVAEVALCALASSTLDHFAGSVSQTLAALVTKLHTYYRV